MQKRNNGEAKLGITLIEWAEYALPQVTLWKVQNEGASNAIQGAYRKKQGVRAGVHDYHLIWPGRNYATIELKDPDKPNAKYSPSQKDFAAHMDRAGFPHACCHNGNEIVSALKSWGLTPLYPFPVANQEAARQMRQQVWADALYGR